MLPAISSTSTRMYLQFTTTSSPGKTGREQEVELSARLRTFEATGE